MPPELQSKRHAKESAADGSANSRLSGYHQSVIDVAMVVVKRASSR
jgi:hypothetical protein